MSSEVPIEEPPPGAAPGLAAVLLAAGLGKRMRSRLPKVLHEIAGVPLAGHVLRALAPLAPVRTVLVVGHGGEQVRARLGPAYEYVTQAEQLGTGHALLQARAAVERHTGTVLVLYGDTPLLRTSVLQDLVRVHQTTPGTRVTMLTCVAQDPAGYGRITRNSAGAVTGIVEDRVATPDQRTITEINSGIYCFDSAWLWPRLAALPIHPGTGEYFVTDLIAIAIDEAAGSVQALTVVGLEEAAGINNRVQLAEADAILRDRIRTTWMLEGVTMIDPRTTYIDADVTLGEDTILYPGCYLQGQTRIGVGCRIGPEARLVDAVVGDGCVVGGSLLEGCTLEAGVDVGTFNHLRTGAYLAHGVHIGNFAEVKQSRLGPAVKMGHFSYIGDAEIGAHTNIGAGTITCNLAADGAKHRTMIGSDVFLGCDTMLRAPVAIGAGAATGAGAVVTRDVPPGMLAVGMPARLLRRGAVTTDPPGATPAAAVLDGSSDPA